MCLCAGAAVGPPAEDRPFSWLCSDFVFRNGSVAPASPELSFLRLLPAAAVNVVLSVVTVELSVSCHYGHLPNLSFTVSFLIFPLQYTIQSILYPSIPVLLLFHNLFTENLLLFFFSFFLQPYTEFLQAFIHHVCRNVLDDALGDGIQHSFAYEVTFDEE